MKRPNRKSELFLSARVCICVCVCLRACVRARMCVLRSLRWSLTVAVPGGMFCCQLGLVCAEGPRQLPSWRRGCQSCVARESTPARARRLRFAVRGCPSGTPRPSRVLAGGFPVKPPFGARGGGPTAALGAFWAHCAARRGRRCPDGRATCRRRLSRPGRLKVRCPRRPCDIPRYGPALLCRRVLLLRAIPAGVSVSPAGDRSPNGISDTPECLMGTHSKLT